EGSKRGLIRHTESVALAGRPRTSGGRISGAIGASAWARRDPVGGEGGDGEAAGKGENGAGRLRDSASASKSGVFADGLPAPSATLCGSMESLGLFHPAVRTWFERRFPLGPTE